MQSESQDRLVSSFKILLTCEISSSHGGEYEAQNLLGCTAVFLIECRRFRGTCCLHHRPDNGESTYLWNFGRHSIKNTAVHPRRFWASFLLTVYYTERFFHHLEECIMAKVYLSTSIWIECDEDCIELNLVCNNQFAARSNVISQHQPVGVEENNGKYRSVHPVSCTRITTSRPRRSVIFG
jgi:hypothetical protein